MGFLASTNNWLYQCVWGFHIPDPFFPLFFLATFEEESLDEEGIVS